MLETTFSLAAADWEGALGGLLDLERAKDGEDAQLIIAIVDDLPHPGRSYYLYQGNLYRPRVELNDRDLANRQILRMVVAHELGHALGLWGHSDYPGDLMYYMPERATPSKRDIRTIRLLYGLD